MVDGAASVKPLTYPMQPGDRIADRFVLQHIAGEGGMGTVWCAHDQLHDQRVALKVALRDAPEQVERLKRESRLLARLQNPTVIQYLCHGVTESDLYYLVMEWLEGEDLSVRLQRGPLWIDDSLTFAQTVARTLAAVHEQGIVHRDLKPSNLFLVKGDLTKVKIIDFGIASLADEHHTLSKPVGTPFYMSPEQARGDEHIDPRADLYSLGCILFECLTGSPPFVAPTAMAVLAKVLFEDTPAPSLYRPDLPIAIDDLVLQLLAKDVDSRPVSASAVVQAIDGLRSEKKEAWSRSSQTPIPVLTKSERRLVSVVLASEPTPDRISTPEPDPVQSGRQKTISLPMIAPSVPELRELVAPYGAQLEVLRDRSIAAVISGRTSPIDIATNAARAALAIQDMLPTTQVALVTGWEVFSGMQPLGQVIDAAAALLESRTSPLLGHVILDRMTAALLSEHFVLVWDDQAPTLLSERDDEAPQRTLLGKPTQCVGRKRELRLLEDLFDECHSEGVSRAVVITAEPGMGKSRLREEFTLQLKAHHPSVEIWTARGDTMRQKAPFGLLGQCIRRAANLHDGEPLDVRRQKLAARVASHVKPDMQRRVTEFLGEMIGTPFPEDERVQLHAARQQAILMSDQMRRAWVDFVEAECKVHPILLILEDLQWGDRPTVDYVHTVLRLLYNQPLLVLALARPEVHDSFPELWLDRNVTHLRLGPLPRTACEGLVQQILGDDLSPDSIRGIVERSAGNPFFLEELVRSLAEGHAEQVPQTVLATIQSRFSLLEAEARRVLRAASLFGEIFWRNAIASFLGSSQDPSRLDKWLDELEQREWIVGQFESKFPGDKEYVFRHGLIHEAAYGMLTNEDRTLGHRLVAQWLEDVNETDAMALATQFELAGVLDAAARCYGSAAQQALEGNDLGAAMDRVDRAIAYGATGPSLGQLLLVRAEAYRWQGNFSEGQKWATQAMDCFEQGSASWYAAIREALASMVDLQARDRVVNMADMLNALWQGPEAATGPQAIAMAWMAIKLFEAALYARAAPLHQLLVSVEPRFRADPAIHVYILMEQAFRAGYLGNMAAFGKMLPIVLNQFEQLGDLRNVAHMQVNLAHVYNELGAYCENLKLLDALIVTSRRLGLGSIEAGAQASLGRTLMGLGLLNDAAEAQTAAIRLLAAQGDQRLEGASHAYLAMILQQLGHLDQAETEARSAVVLLESLPSLHPFALAVLSGLLLAQGSTQEALDNANQAILTVHQVEEGEALIRLVYAEVLEGNGEHAAAAKAIALARDRLTARANEIQDDSWRLTFLENVPENARTLELAQLWLD